MSEPDDKGVDSDSGDEAPKRVDPQTRLTSVVSNLQAQRTIDPWLAQVIFGYCPPAEAAKQPFPPSSAIE